MWQDAMHSSERTGVPISGAAARGSNIMYCDVRLPSGAGIIFECRLRTWKKAKSVTTQSDSGSTKQHGSLRRMITGAEL